MKTVKITLILALAFILLQRDVPLQVLEAQSIFTTFTDLYELPDGIAVDAQGRVYIHYEERRSTELVRLNADGTYVDQVSFGVGLFEKSLFIGSRLVYNPNLDEILLLTPEGDIYLIDTNQPLPGQGSEDQAPLMSLDLNNMALTISNAYDIETNQNVSFDLDDETALYGDFALYLPPAPAQPHLVITATTQTSLRPFVLDLTLDTNLRSIVNAQVLLTSTAIPATMGNGARGIALNDQGIGLTTLPESLSSGLTQEVAVAFSIAGQLSQPQVLFNSLDLPSEGMTANSRGDFYIASGDIGSSRCAPNQSGAFIIISVDITSGLPLSLAPPAGTTTSGVSSQPECVRIATAIDPIVSSRDVAMSPADQHVYMTINNLDRVIGAPQSNLITTLP